MIITAKRIQESKDKLSSLSTDELERIKSIYLNKIRKLLSVKISVIVEDSLQWNLLRYVQVSKLLNQRQENA